MTGRFLFWGIAVAFSLGLHALVGFVMAWSFQPQAVADQPTSEMRLELDTHQVKQTEAPQETAEGTRADEAEASGKSLNQSTVRRSQAQDVTEQSAEAALPAAASALLVKADETPGDRVSSARTDTAVVKSVEPKAHANLNPVSGQTSLAPPVAVPNQFSSTVLPAFDVVQSAATEAFAMPAPVQANVGRVSPPSPPPSFAATSQSPASEAATAAEYIAEATAAQGVEPVGERATASLAWSGTGPGTIDPLSLAAINEFVGLTDASATEGYSGTVRDGIGSSLQGFDCTRIQAEFLPDTGQLRLTGHVPEESDRQSVLAAMQQHVGTSIPVTDNMLVLPRPQCGALAAISAIGLPQSNELLTNPRLVGASAHAREYSYGEGDAFSFEFTGADYDSYIYVDYFDADGNVIHLIPNEYVPLLPTSADALVADVGKALNITIGPPFGQEIAAAFAVTEPLGTEPRPIVEPAAPYLEWVRTRVAEARDKSPGFKGEWVYFFITTRPLLD